VELAGWDGTGRPKDRKAWGVYGSLWGGEEKSRHVKSKYGLCGWRKLMFPYGEFSVFEKKNKVYASPENNIFCVC